MGDVVETAPGHAQPAAAHRRDLNFVQGFFSMGNAIAMCIAYYLALGLVHGVSIALAPIPLIVIAHALYLVIYVMEHYGFISEVSTNNLINQVETMSLAGNFFRSYAAFSPLDQV